MLVDEILAKPSYWACLNITRDNFLQVGMYSDGLDEFRSPTDPGALPEGEQEQNLFCVICGDYGVGKTTLLYRFLEGRILTQEEIMAAQTQDFVRKRVRLHHCVRVYFFSLNNACRTIC